MAIADQFQQFLGRAPSQAEAEYFQKFITEGSIQPHEIGQILQATPEFQRSQLTKDTAAFGQQLNAQNEAILGQAGAQAQSRFAGLGRPNTSALGASVMQAGGQLAQNRQSALASFYGQGLQTGAGLRQQEGQSGLDRGYGMRDENRQLGQQMQLAKYGQDNYNNYLNQARRQQQRQGMAGFGGALAGAGIGALLAAPTGGMSMGTGAMLGGSLGGKAGGMF